MSVDCCEDKAGELRGTQARVLKLVLAINATMFVVEFGAGVVVRSTALLADSLDMLGDASVYLVSLYVLGKGARWEAGAAVFKGVLMALFGVGVAVQAVARAFSSVVPDAAGMGVVGALALVANSVCLALLLRHRDQGLNMRSTWLCSRNDVIANVSVLIAAALVAGTGSRWPDLLVGAAISGLFLTSAFSVLRRSVFALRTLASQSARG